MSKELEALERLCDLAMCGDLQFHKRHNIWARFQGIEKYKPSIETALKALQIIKEKKVDIEQIIENPDMDNVIWYNTSFTGVLCEGWRMLTQEEYDLVREVLYE